MRPLDLPVAVAGASSTVSAEAFGLRVARLAGLRTVRLADDLTDVEGSLVLARGTRLTPGLATERLGRHRLAAPLEAVLAVDDAASSLTLAAEALVALHGHALLTRLMAGAGGAGFVSACLARVELPAPLALHVEMARALAPTLYTHSLLSSLTCAALGRVAGEDAAGCDRLAVVGLVHDLGLLHADDAVLEGRPHLTPAQRAQYIAHADLSAALLRAHAPFAGAVAEAVEAHHERLDGSGFPRRLGGATVPAWGRIAALAELLTSIETDGGILDVIRLSNMLRLDSAGFDGPLADAVLALCDDEERS